LFGWWLIVFAPAEKLCVAAAMAHSITSIHDHQMRAFVAPTDSAWFDFLSLQQGVDEVNFWMPKPWGGRFGVLKRGEPLLFKLKRDRNAIAGGGFFEHYTELPISLAWEAFGIKNGAPSLESVRESIARLRRERPGPWSDYTIGCILLTEPFFWPMDLWIPDPPGSSATSYAAEHTI
jgi:putative restriction endonuclease